MCSWRFMNIHNCDFRKTVYCVYNVKLYAPQIFILQKCVVVCVRVCGVCGVCVVCVCVCVCKCDHFSNVGRTWSPSMLALNRADN